MTAVEEILAGYPGLQADQEAFYKDLHRHPELSHQEHRTAQRVAGQLQTCGFTVQTGIGGTGVVGVLVNGTGPAVLLRAELDALPIKEDTGADYASTATTTGPMAAKCPSPTPAATTCTWPACSARPSCWLITPASGAAP
jgi:metal-dependent amidase/aminoacylase/carboxypeptidase family protein